MKTALTQTFAFTASLFTQCKDQNSTKTRSNLRRHILGGIIVALLGLVSVNKADAAVLASDATYSIDQTSGAPYSDISGTGTRLTDLGTTYDDVSFDVALAAPFTFYGTAYATMSVSTNGLITFGDTNSTFTNYALSDPSSGIVNPSVVVYWDDLYFVSSQPGALYSLTSGTTTTVEWFQVHHINDFAGPDTFTFQAVFDSATGTIKLNYLDATAGGQGVNAAGDDVSVSDGGSATVGVKGPDTFAQVGFGTPGSVLSGWTLTITSGPPPEELSATMTGLPLANAQGPMLINAGQTVTGDVNNHLFNLIAGDGEEAANDGLASAMDDGVIVGQGDGPEDPIARKGLRSRQWEVFTTVNYGNVNLRSIGAQAGVQIDAWAPSIGIQRHLSRGLAVGFAASFLTSDQSYTGGLGSVQLEGPALSAYLTFVRKNFWNSLLYSFGTYELDSTRNPGFAFPQAFGTTRTYTHAVQYNTGWNFRFQNNTLVTGPFAGIDWLHGSVDAYSETGGGAAALRYNEQSYESLVTRVGWGVSKKFKTGFADITPQVRLSYERQNLENNGTSVSLIAAPFTAAGGNQSPGQDYLAAGAGVNFAFKDQCGVLLTYQGQFFRSDMSAHFGAVKLSYRF
jgi:uncharacterized protein YhjY with autotransporter beta-barrel domain